MGNSEDERVLSIAALGRPFRLGMLYDSRTEKLIPGITLWDQTTLENRTVQPQETSDFHVLCSDSLDDKASALEVNASLKLSVLGGLVDVEGAAKYLDNRKSSNHQERITLQYKCTTRTEMMTMEQLGQGKVQHPEVFNHGTATHVVTSIVYGAQAFFTFERHHSSSDQGRKIEGNVHAIIKKIPCMQIDGKGELDMSDEEKSKTEDFTCRFFGDFLLRQNPSSFLDAVKIYQELPTLLGKAGENSVPVKVQLYPLTLLDRKATRLIREISVNLVSETERFFEDMHELNIKCKDILKSDAVKSFLAIQHQMKEFVNLTETYKRGIQKELFVMLPRIRGGGDEERSLVDLLNKINNSPVSILALHSWLQEKNTQIKILSEYIRAMANIKFATEPGDLESVVMSPENTYTLCLTISMPSNDSQLEKMKQYCLEKLFSSNSKRASQRITTQLMNNTSMMEVAGVFRDFYEVNETKKRMSFLVAQEFSASDAFHAQVKYYKYGSLVSNDYELPSMPEKVKALVDDTTHRSVSISWNPPKYGASNITSYIISCCKYSTEKEISRVTVDGDSKQVTIPGLAANTEYEVRVWGRCEVGDGPVGDAKVMVKTRPASQPEMLRALKASPTTVLLTWQAPACVADGCSVEQHIIKQETKAGHWEEKLRITSSEFSCKIEVSPSTVSFKVAASCGSAGLSCDSEPCTIDLTKPTTRKTIKQYICANSVPTPNNAHIYVPQMKLVASSSTDMIDKYEFGEKQFGVQEKVVMLVGATGSGKTTLINGLVNYIFGVEWKDPYRFKMILEPNVANQAMSQTTKITAYTLHHMEGFQVPYTVTIVDTPGFGDVSGIMRDKEITENIRKFFTTSGDKGISHIDAVGFVANSSLPRLTPTQRYIFDQILSLFGKDIGDNIFLLLTFADGKKPQVLSGIKEAKIPYKKHFKFNNSALYALQGGQCNRKVNDSDEEGDGDFDNMFWEMGVKSFTLFLDQINIVESKSLILTQDVLNERNRLQIYIAGIQRDIRQGLSTLDRLKKEKEMLEKHRADIKRNRNFEYEVDEEIFVTVPIPAGQYVTNCLNCNRTCHEFCKIPHDNLKKGCWAITNDNCRICPNKCIWSVHKNFPYKYELQVKKTRKTVNELRLRYEEATQRTLSAENLVEEVNEEFNALKVKVLGMTHSVRMSLQRLQEIALRPSPMTTVQYLDVLIEAEKSQGHPGWQARLEQLITVKKEAEYMEMIANQGFDPFQQYSEKLQLKMRHSRNKIWARVFDYFKK